MRAPDAGTGTALAEPEFEVLGARPVRYAAAPTIALDLQVSEPSGRSVYMLALKIQLMIEPARRTYDDATRERLAGLFGPPERWSVTTRSLVWAQLDVVVPAFTGSTTVTVPVTCSYDLEVVAGKYLRALPDGEAPLALHFNGVVYYPNDEGGLQITLVPWSRSIGFRMPVSVFTETIEHYYPNTGWVALRGETLDALERRRVADGAATLDDCLQGLLRGDALEQLVESLLFEGYALYPYTPGATKNATPTPFGIVYPPRYAAGSSTTFDHLELRCALAAGADATLEAEVRCLVGSGERHVAEPRRLALGPVAVGELVEAPSEQAETLDRLDVSLRLAASALEDGTFEVALRVENRTPCDAGLDRAGALVRSLLSTHPLIRVRGGRFHSPLDSPRASVNTYPVLATAGDDVVLGAAIVLPDHPQIAPESLGGLFDSTEIEEALLLHVRTLTDAERAEIEADDPAVRQMVARAAAATPADIVALHGRVTLRDPVTTEPPTPPPGLADPSAGQAEAEVDGVTFRRGGHVRIRPDARADLHARLLDGRSATIERIFTDYDGKTHMGVTIDDDPGQELLRETGRFLFFFAPELEVIEE